MAAPRAVKVVALSQAHRGHGNSTAAFYLGQALAQQNVPILLADLTERHARLADLKGHGPTPKLVVWAPPLAAMRDIPATLEKARGEIAGKASAMLLDVDLTTLDHLATQGNLPVDYLVVGVEHTPEAEKAVDRATAKFEALRDRNRVGVVFTRISAENATDLPDQTDEGHLPVLGHWPADYRLATADEFSASGPNQAQPHQPYLSAIARLASLLIRLVPLPRQS